MKIEFGDKKDYIEFTRNKDKFYVTLSAQTPENRFKTTVNSASISFEELSKLFLSCLFDSEIELFANSLLKKE